MGAILVSGALAGIALHRYFKSHEPASILSAVSTTIATDAVVILVLSRFLETNLSLAQLVALGVTTVATLLLSISLYRLGPWHPLSRYPGPTLYKFTKLRVVWSSWKGTHFKEMEQLHKKYGPVVRMAPNAISIIDVAAVSSVYGANGLPKDRYYRARRVRSDPPVISMTGTEHALRRQLWNHGLGRSALPTHVSLAAKGWERLQSQLNKAADEARVVDMSTWLRFYSFDFMGNFAFGREFGLVESGRDERGAWGIIQRYVAATDIIGHLPWIGYRASFIPGLYNRLTDMRQLGRECVNDRLKRPATALDLWYYLGAEDTTNSKATPPLSGDAQAAEGVLALIAGSDTSATAMISTVYYLLSHPSSLIKARQEVDAAAFNGLAPWATTDCHALLPYLDACIDESLRLLPVVPTNGSRGVPAGSGGKSISGFFVPEGTEVFVSPYHLHHDPRYFSPETEEFRPERWLEPEGWNTVRGAYMPFSMGPAQCVGKSLAKAEMVLVLSGLLRYYEMEFAKGYDPSDYTANIREHIVLDVPPLPVLLRRRA